MAPVPPIVAEQIAAAEAGMPNLQSSQVGELAVMTVVPPAPNEAWPRSNPDVTTTPKLLSYTVVSEEELRRIQVHTAWLEEHLPLFERMVRAAEGNKLTMERMADAAVVMSQVPRYTDDQLAAMFFPSVFAQMPTASARDINMRLSALVQMHKAFFQP